MADGDGVVGFRRGWAGSSRVWWREGRALRSRRFSRDFPPARPVCRRGCAPPPRYSRLAGARRGSFCGSHRESDVCSSVLARGLGRSRRRATELGERATGGERMKDASGCSRRISKNVPPARAVCRRGCAPAPRYSRLAGAWRGLCGTAHLAAFAVRRADHRTGVGACDADGCGTPLGVRRLM